MKFKKMLIFCDGGSFDERNYFLDLDSRGNPVEIPDDLVLEYEELLPKWKALQSRLKSYYWIARYESEGKMELAQRVRDMGV